MPPRDTLDFAVALALGAVLGWGLVTVLRSDEEEPALAKGRLSLARSASRRDGEPTMSADLKGELGRVAREAGEQLTAGVLHRLGQRFLGTGSARGR